MEYCPECGEKIDEGDEFCSNCGASLTGTESSPVRIRGGSAETSLGVSENIEAVLSYLLLWVSGLIIYVLEEDNRFVRFHAMQSIIVFLPLTIISWIFGSFGGPFWWAFGGPFLFIGWIVGLVIFVLWLVLMFKAYQGEMYELPFAGEIAKRKTAK